MDFDSVLVTVWLCSAMSGLLMYQQAPESNHRNFEKRTSTVTQKSSKNLDWTATPVRKKKKTRENVVLILEEGKATLQRPAR